MLDWMLLYVCRLVRMLICAEGCFVIPRGVGAVARPVPGSGVGPPGGGIAGPVPRTAVGAPEGGGGGARGSAEGGSGLRSRGARPPEGALGAPADAQGPSELPPESPQRRALASKYMVLLRTKIVSRRTLNHTRSFTEPPPRPPKSSQGCPK